MKLNLILDIMFIVQGIAYIVAFLTVGAPALTLILATMLIAAGCLSIGIELGYNLAKRGGNL